MERDYLKDWSGALERDMEVLRFGRAGVPVLALPTSQGRFYQWEDFGLVGAVADRVDAGQLHVWCVDSVDGESWYAKDRHPRQRLERHLQYERYLVDELMPRIVLVELLLSGGLGGRLIERLHQAGATVIAVSPLAAREVASELGAAAFLQKPIDPLVFVSTVRDLLGTSAIIRRQSDVPRM